MAKPKLEDLVVGKGPEAVRGKTVVIVIHTPVADFPKFLPIARRLLASLQFPNP